MASIIEGYKFLFVDLGDPRVYNWPLMSGPWIGLGIIVLYFYIIFDFLPSYMSNKKPYSLKVILAIYNTFQVIACIILIYGAISAGVNSFILKTMMIDLIDGVRCLTGLSVHNLFVAMFNNTNFQISTSGWTTYYKLGCQELDTSGTKPATSMAGYVWWTLILKLVELVETIFFIFRKKFNQVSALHVYHHVSTVIIAWMTCKYYPGGLLTLSIILNCFVHIVMYTYYFLACFGPKIQKKLETLKPKLTILQLVQLVLIAAYNAQTLSSKCKVPPLVAFIVIPDIAILVYFFTQFYIKAYTKKRI